MPFTLKQNAANQMSCTMLHYILLTLFLMKHCPAFLADPYHCGFSRYPAAIQAWGFSCMYPTLEMNTFCIYRFLKVCQKQLSKNVNLSFWTFRHLIQVRLDISTKDLDDKEQCY